MPGFPSFSDRPRTRLRLEALEDRSMQGGAGTTADLATQATTLPTLSVEANSDVRVIADTPTYHGPSAPKSPPIVAPPVNRGDPYLPTSRDPYLPATPVP